MPSKKRKCKCLPKLEREYTTNATSPKDYEDVYEALLSQTKIAQKYESLSKSKLKCIFKSKKRKQICGETIVPMSPDMCTRLRYISHCSKEPAKFTKQVEPKRYDICECDLGKQMPQGSAKSKKQVRYSDQSPISINMPKPLPLVKHECPALSVQSPKMSGEVITAVRAAVTSTDYRPPMPGKSGHDLFKPHSGIVVNRDKEFVAETLPLGPEIGKVRKHKKGRPHKCKHRKCGKETCPKFATRHKQSKGKFGRRQAIRRGGSLIPYTTLGAKDGKAKPKNLYKAEDTGCGLDEIPKPIHVHVPPHLKQGMLQTHSLTVIPCTKDRKPAVHYGILKGSFNMYDNKFGGRSRGRQAVTMSVMAYCLAFHYHPKQWTMKLVDNLVDAGDTWYIQCADKVHDHSAVQGMCEVLPFGKKQTLILNGKRMQVLLGEPDVVGYTMSLDPTVYNLCRGLKAFFKNNRAGILLTRILKVVIWKDKVCYYIFDPAGRDARAFSNFATGCAALINIKDLGSVADVLLARSILEDQKYVLAPVKVLKMMDEKCDEDFDSDKELTQAEKAMMGYRILNENCAIVNANMHLGDRCFEDAKFRQALPIAIAAMTYAKISPPNTWFSKTLDKVLRLGNKLYVDSIHPKVMIDISIDNIPNEITIGPYACEIIIYRERIKGQLFTTKECLLNIRTGLIEFFKNEYNSGILEFNNYAIAVWRQKEMFYLFDPYPRTNDGLKTFTAGKACCLMLLNPATMADVFSKNWIYLPATTHFYIHAFKVLKLKKREPKLQILCTLSDEQLPGAKKVNRKVLPMGYAHGDGRDVLHTVLPAETIDQLPTAPLLDEEQLGDIISLVDSIQEDYLPPIPLRYKNLPPEPLEEKVVSLDSPTVSLTQVVPPWPRVRDKSGESPEPDPEREPTPPPTPPPPPPPEGEEEAEEEEELDEEAMKKKKEEEARKKAEEEEARRKAEELPPPLPPPPPSPQPEPEVELAQFEPQVELSPDQPDVAQSKEAVKVDRRILLTEDAKYRSKMRKIRGTLTTPLIEQYANITPMEELEKPSNFKNLPDFTQIIRAGSAITDKNAIDILPFTAIIAIVTSYKYMINTWTVGIVNFVLDTGKELHKKKKEKFQLAPVHVLPKIVIGHQAYSAHIDVITEGPTWKLEEIMEHKFLHKYDRGMITTSTYSCAFFQKNGLYYLYDGSPCNPMGLRQISDKGTGSNTQGCKACFLRFQSLHDLVARIAYNKDGNTEDQHFIISRIIVRTLMTEPRLQLPDDYDFTTGKAKSKKAKFSIIEEKTGSKELITKSETAIGYQKVENVYRIDGTTALAGSRSSSPLIGECHFVGLIAMLLATMHPINTWDHLMVDTCLEKGSEIKQRATNLSVCEKRVIKNILLDGKLIDVNIKKILVVNDNPEKSLMQYLNAVLQRLRFVMMRFCECSLVICHTEGNFHLFDPYQNSNTTPPTKVAGWTLYTSMDSLCSELQKLSNQPNSPEFYTFELTSIKTRPRWATFNYRLSPLFKPDENPNTPYLKLKKPRAIVDEKVYWINIEAVPWARWTPTNSLGIERKTPRALWKNWDIEFPGDLYSLWGTIHPMDTMFNEHRGTQYLEVCVVALVMVKACNLSAWTSSLLDGIVDGGNKYHMKNVDKNWKNHEITPENMPTSFDMYPYSFSVKFNKIIFGFVYNLYSDRFNLSKALVYFFEKNTTGILVSPRKNIAFGKVGTSYFMFDCQTYGLPIFSPGQGAAYILKCESLNRLIYCMAITMNVKRHGHLFHLYSANVSLTEKAK